MPTRDNVRFNGGHSHSDYCDNILSQYFDYQKFCPEVAAGLVHLAQRYD